MDKKQGSRGGWCRCLKSEAARWGRVVGSSAATPRGDASLCHRHRHCRHPPSPRATPCQPQACCAGTYIPFSSTTQYPTSPRPRPSAPRRPPAHDPPKHPQRLPPKHMLHSLGCALPLCSQTATCRCPSPLGDESSTIWTYFVGSGTFIPSVGHVLLLALLHGVWYSLRWYIQPLTSPQSHTRPLTGGGVPAGAARLGDVEVLHHTALQHRRLVDVVQL